MSESTTILSVEGNEIYRQVVDFIAVDAAPEFSMAGTGIEIEQVIESIDANSETAAIINDEKLQARLGELSVECPYRNKVCRIFGTWQGLSKDLEGNGNSEAIELRLDEEFVAIPVRFDVLPIKRDDVHIVAPVLVSKTTIDNERGEPEVNLLLTPLDEGALALFTPSLN